MYVATGDKGYIQVSILSYISSTIVLSLQNLFGKYIPASIKYMINEWSKCYLKNHNMLYGVCLVKVEEESIN